MLTEIFYYSYYRPYLVNLSKTNNSTKKQPITNKKKLVLENQNEVLLNKSLTKEVIYYVRNITNSIVGTKDSANNIIRDIMNFNNNIYKRDYTTAKRWIGEDLEDFVKQYNFSFDFMNNQEHSYGLRDFAFNLHQIVDSGIDRLNLLGLSHDDNKLVFNHLSFNNIDKPEFNVALGENINIFKNIYSISTNALSEPMTNHMNFKGLSHYYNYKMGQVVDETFKIIESGLIINHAI